jgi:hypothetical protein
MALLPDLRFAIRIISAKDRSRRSLIFFSGPEFAPSLRGGRLQRIYAL